MHPDLIAPTGLEAALYESAPLAPLEGAVVGHGAFATTCDDANAAVRALDEARLDAARGRRRHARRERQVDPLGAMTAKQRFEALARGRTSGERDRAGHVFVQAVQSEDPVPKLLAQQIAESRAAAPGRVDDEHARRFVGDDQGVVFVEDLDGAHRSARARRDPRVPGPQCGERCADMLRGAFDHPIPVGSGQVRSA